MLKLSGPNRFHVIPRGFFFFKMKKLVILLWMIFFLIICSNLVTLSINIAIVSMVRPMPNVGANNTKTIVCPNTSFYWYETEDEKQVQRNYNQEDTYDWNNYEKRMVLSAFHWISWLPILPAGVLAQKFGSKIVVGSALFISAIMSSIIPLVANSGARAVEYIRVIQGFLVSMILPSGIITISGNWSSVEDRGKFVAAVLGGLTISLSLGSYVFGFIGQYLHWKYIFHLTSLCGTVWTVFWYFLVSDSPEIHPMISMKEKNEILARRKHTMGNENIPIPWKHILTSVPLNLCYLNTGAMMVNFFILGTYLPLYLNDMYGFDSNQSGILISVSQLVCGGVSLALGWFTDFFVKKRWLSVSNTRKLFGAFGCFSSALPLALMAFAKCNVVATIVFSMLSSCFRCVFVFGLEPALFDMSPNFCGVTHGLLGTASEIIMLLFSMAVGYFTKILPTEEFWKVVFLLTAAISIVPSILFTIWGSADLQSWNQGATKISLENKTVQNDTHFSLMNERHKTNCVEVHNGDEDIMD